MEKQRDKVKGKTAWNKGLTIDDERVRKYARKKGVFKHSDETKLKISNSKKGISNAIKNKDEWRKNLSNSLKGKKKSDAHAEKCRKVAVGRIWINNGSESKMIYPEDLETYIKEGYKKGRVKWQK